MMNGGQSEWETNIAQMLSKTKYNLATLQRYHPASPPPPPAPPYYNSNSYTLSRDPIGYSNHVNNNSYRFSDPNNNNFPPPPVIVKNQPQSQYATSPWAEDDAGPPQPPLVNKAITPTDSSTRGGERGLNNTMGGTTSLAGQIRESSLSQGQLLAHPRAVQSLQQQVDSLAADLTKVMTELVSATRLLRTQQAQIDTLQGEVMVKAASMARMEAWKGEEDAWRARVDGVLTGLTNDVRGFEKRLLLQQDALTQRVTVMDLRQATNAVELGFATAVDTALAPVQMHHKRELEAVKKQFLAQRDALEMIQVELASMPSGLNAEAAKAMVIKAVAEAENRVAKTVGGLVDDRIQEQIRTLGEGLQRSHAPPPPPPPPPTGRTASSSTTPAQDLDKFEGRLRELEERLGDVDGTDDRINRLEDQLNETGKALGGEMQDLESRLQNDLLAVIGGVSEDFRHELQEVQERIGVVEAKLGIVPPRRLSAEEGMMMEEEFEEGERSPASPSSPLGGEERLHEAQAVERESPVLTRHGSEGLEERTERVEGRMDEVREEFNVLMEEVQAMEAKHHESLSTVLREAEALRSSLDTLQAGHKVLESLPDKVHQVELAQEQMEKTLATTMEDVKNRLASSSSSSPASTPDQEPQSQALLTSVAQEVESHKRKVESYADLEGRLESTERRVDDRVNGLQEEVVKAVQTQEATAREMEGKLMVVEQALDQVTEQVKGVEAMVGSDEVGARLAPALDPLDARLVQVEGQMASLQDAGRLQAKAMTSQVAQLAGEVEALSSFVQGVNQAVGGMLHTQDGVKEQVKELMGRIEQSEQGMTAQVHEVAAIKAQVGQVCSHLQALEKNMDEVMHASTQASTAAPLAAVPSASQGSKGPQPVSINESKVTADSEKKEEEEEQDERVTSAASSSLHESHQQQQQEEEEEEEEEDIDENSDARSEVASSQDDQLPTRQEPSDLTGLEHDGASGDVEREAFGAGDERLSGPEEGMDSPSSPRDQAETSSLPSFNHQHDDELKDSIGRGTPSPRRDQGGESEEIDDYSDDAMSEALSESVASLEERVEDQEVKEGEGHQHQEMQQDDLSGDEEKENLLELKDQGVHGDDEGGQEQGQLAQQSRLSQPQQEEEETTSLHSESFDDDDALPMMDLEEPQGRSSLQPSREESPPPRQLASQDDAALVQSQHKEASPSSRGGAALASTSPLPPLPGQRAHSSHSHEDDHDSPAPHDHDQDLDAALGLGPGASALDYDDVSLPPESDDDDDMELPLPESDDDGDISIDSAEYKTTPTKPPAPSLSAAAPAESSQRSRGRERILRFSREEVSAARSDDDDEADKPASLEDDGHQGAEGDDDDVAEAEGGDGGWDSWDEDEAEEENGDKIAQHALEPKRLAKSPVSNGVEGGDDDNDHLDLLPDDGQGMTSSPNQKEEGQGEGDLDGGHGGGFDDDLAADMEAEHHRAEEAFDGVDEGGRGSIPAFRLNSLLQGLNVVLGPEEVQSLIMRLADKRRCIPRSNFLDWYVSFKFDGEDVEEYDEDEEDYEDDYLRRLPGHEEEEEEEEDGDQGSIRAERSVHHPNAAGMDSGRGDEGEEGEIEEEDYSVGEDEGEEDDYFYAVPTNDFGSRHVNPFSGQNQEPAAAHAGGGASNPPSVPQESASRREVVPNQQANARRADPVVARGRHLPLEEEDL